VTYLRLTAYALAAGLAGLAAFQLAARAQARPPAAPMAPVLAVRGNHLVDQAGAVVRLTGEPSLITSYAGTPTRTYGQGYRDHLAALHRTG
jgi:hypothetical protein